MQEIRYSKAYWKRILEAKSGSLTGSELEDLARIYRAGLLNHAMAYAAGSDVVYKGKWYGTENMGFDGDPAEYKVIPAKTIFETDYAELELKALSRLSRDDLAVLAEKIKEPRRYSREYWAKILFSIPGNLDTASADVRRRVAMAGLTEVARSFALGLKVYHKGDPSDVLDFTGPPGSYTVEQEAKKEAEKGESYFVLLGASELFKPKPETSAVLWRGPFRSQEDAIASMRSEQEARIAREVKPAGLYADKAAAFAIVKLEGLFCPEFAVSIVSQLYEEKPEPRYLNAKGERE